MPYLGESDITRLLPEALTADIEPVLADETGLVRADAAVNQSAMFSPNTETISIFHSSSSNGRMYHDLDPLP
jgi:hypothetical protein